MTVTTSAPGRAAPPRTDRQETVMAADVADTPPDYVRERAARALEHLRTQDLDDLDTATFSAVTDLTTFARCVLAQGGAA